MSAGAAVGAAPSAPMGALAQPTLILASSILACSLVLAGAPTPVRAPVVLAFFCFVPGLALVRPLELGSVTAAAALAIALSLALTGAIAGVLLYLHLWSPEAVLLVVVAFTVAATLKEIGAAARGGAAHARFLQPATLGPDEDGNALPALRRHLILATAQKIQPELWVVEDLDLRLRRHLPASARDRGTPAARGAPRGVRVTAISEADRVPLDWRLRGEAPTSRGRAWRTGLALEAIDGVCALGCEPAIIACGPAYGTSPTFRAGLEARGLRYVIRLDAAAAFDQLAARDDQRRRLTLAGKRRAIGECLRERQGVPEPITWPRVRGRAARSRFAVLPLDDRLLVCAWPETEEQPTRFWLSNLPHETPVLRLASLATLPYRNTSDGEPSFCHHVCSSPSAAIPALQLELTMETLTQQFRALRTHRTPLGAAE